MEQEHRITYKAGITRTPSDFLCQDGELAECINLTTDNEELKPMVQPAEYITSATGQYNSQTGQNDPLTDYKVLYIHKFDGNERYIIAVPESYSTTYLAWTTKSGSQLTWGGWIVEQSQGHQAIIPYTESMLITSIGKTLIINKNNESDSPVYGLWTSGGYVMFMDIPKPEVEFYLLGVFAHRSSPAFALLKEFSAENSLKYDGALAEGLIVEDQEKLNDLIVALYSKNKISISRKKLFCEPFFVRTALELYDGSYMHISDPILLFPSVTENTEFSPNSSRNELSARTHGCKLYYNNKTVIDKYKDIVKGVVLFVSDGISIYDVSSDQPQPELFTDYTVNGIFRTSNLADQNSDKSVFRKKPQGTGQLNLRFYKAIKNRPESEIEAEIKGCSIFYRLCKLPYNGTKFTNVAENIDTHDLEYITNRDRLEYDDYYSFCPLNASVLYPYNYRLNMAGVRRGFFDGFNFFLPYDNTSTLSYDIYVRIKTESGNRIVKQRILNTYQKMGIWFYYPDPRADWVTIYRITLDQQGVVTASTPILNAALTEHPGLNGAYYFHAYPTGSGDDPTATTGTLNTTDYNFESLPNYIVTTEVNNPWLIKSVGYNRVGIGKILTISTITQALSQDQHGPSPLLVFSESGIWGMSVDNTGQYEYISSVSREICINPNNIIQTDNAVFFVSKKGLMVAEQMGDYRNIIVRCVSEHMNGIAFDTNKLTPLATDTEWAGIVSACRDIYSDSFLNYVRSSALLMAYDYIDSRIIMTNPSKGYSFVYNIADGTISKTVLPAAMNNAVNNYPDYLLQGTFTETVEREGQEPQTVTHNYIYSFYEKPLEVNVAKRSLAFLLTRPMKLAGPVSQASLRQLMNVGMWDEGTALSPWSKVKTEIYVSSDMKTWYSDVSRFGAAARYFRLALYIKMLPTERLSGTILTTQERRGNNMRA